MAKYADIEKALDKIFCPPEGNKGCLIDLGGTGKDELVITLTALNRSFPDFHVSAIYWNGEKNDGSSIAEYSYGSKDLTEIFLTEVLGKDELDEDPSVKIIIVDSSDYLFNIIPVYNHPEIVENDENKKLFREIVKERDGVYSQNLLFFYLLEVRKNEWSNSLKETLTKLLSGVITSQLDSLTSMRRELLNLDSLKEFFNELDIRFEENDIKLFQEILEIAENAKIVKYRLPSGEEFDVEDPKFSRIDIMLPYYDLKEGFKWTITYLGYDFNMIGSLKFKEKPNSLD